MEREQREVCRRKRPVIALLMEFSPAHQRAYRRLGLLSDPWMAEISVERTEFGQKFKWLELLERSMKGPEAFDRLASLLCEQGHAWVADEMYADLEAERGVLGIEEYVYREAGVFVHKYWGKSKRVSDEDKKTFQKLLALRYQVPKEAYRRQIDRIEHQLADALNFKWQGNGKMRDLALKISAFVRTEKERLEQLVEELELVPEPIEEGEDLDAKKTDHVEFLERSIEGMFHAIRRLLFEKELSDGERRRCMNILGVEKSGVQLDVIIGEAMTLAAEKIEKSREDVASSEKLVQSADDCLKKYKEESDNVTSEKDKKMAGLEAQIAEIERKLSERMTELGNMERDRDSWREEYRKLRARIERFEKGRGGPAKSGSGEDSFHDGYKRRRKHRKTADHVDTARVPIRRSASLDSVSEPRSQARTPPFSPRRKDKSRTASDEIRILARRISGADDEELQTPPIDGKYLVEMNPVPHKNSKRVKMVSPRKWNDSDYHGQYSPLHKRLACKICTPREF